MVYLVKNNKTQSGVIMLLKYQIYRSFWVSWRENYQQFFITKA